MNYRGVLGNSVSSNKSMSYKSVSYKSMSYKSVSYKSMSYKSVSCDNTMTGSMESVGRVMYSSHGGSEGLGLCVSPVLSLERLGDGLVRDLAGTNSYESVSSNESVVSSNEELGSSCGSCHQAGDIQKDLHPVCAA